MSSDIPEEVVEVEEAVVEEAVEEAVAEEEAEEEVAPEDAPPPPKRRGRPVGSKNKKSRSWPWSPQSQIHSRSSHASRRSRGRQKLPSQ